MTRREPALVHAAGAIAAVRREASEPEGARSSFIASLVLHALVLALLLLTPSASPFPASGDPEIEVDLQAEMPVAPPIDSAQSETVKQGKPAEAAPAPKPLPVPTPPVVPTPAPPPPPPPAPKPEPLPEPKPAPVRTPPVISHPVADDGELPPPPPVKPKPKVKPPEPVKPPPVKPVEVKPPLPKPPLPKPPVPKPEMKDILQKVPAAKAEAKPHDPLKSIESVLKDIPESPAGKAAGKAHAARSLDDILSGTTADAPGGAPGKTSTRTAGRKRGGGTPLSGADLDGLSKQIRDNWDIPIESDAAAAVSFQLSEDGRIIGDAAGIKKVSGEDDAFRRARRALLLAQPFHLPAAKYDTWREMTVHFSAQGVRF